MTSRVNHMNKDSSLRNTYRPGHEKASNQSPCSCEAHNRAHAHTYNFYTKFVENV